MYSVRSLELDDAGTAQGETKPKSHPIYIYVQTLTRLSINL